MRHVTTASTLKLVAALGLTLALAGCGVRGSLEAPPDSKAISGKATSAEAGAAGSNSAAAPKPHRPFVLDGLLR